MVGSGDNYYIGKINFINSDVFKDSFTSSVSTGYNKNFIIFCVVGIANRSNYIYNFIIETYINFAENFWNNRIEPWHWRNYFIFVY